MTLKRKFERTVFRIPNVQIMYANKMIPSDVRESIWNEPIEFRDAKKKQAYTQWLQDYKCKEDFKTRVYCETISKYWQYSRKKDRYKNYDLILQQICSELNLEKIPECVRAEIVKTLDSYWYYASKMNLEKILI